MNLDHLSKRRAAKSGRCSSWDTTGRNQDAWVIEPGETRVLADIKGPGRITHIWMTQRDHYRDMVLSITWDNAQEPSVRVPLGDFFCLGHGMVNSFESALFTASANWNNKFALGCALNCYVPMPFRERAVVSLTNESKDRHGQYFYVDYETYDEPLPDDECYFHAEFRRENPFGGWSEGMPANVPEANIVNEKKFAYDNNYVILDTKGRGHYIGCNLSVTNYTGGWWGEGDDMIWVDGYKWPPDLHGTGSEDYLNQAWGMQRNAFLHNGSSIYENDTNGYQTSYVFHIENPVHFQKSIKVTIEHGHGNHLRNEMSSVAYWYAEKPGKVAKLPPVAKRQPAMRNSQNVWINEKKQQITKTNVPHNAEIKKNIKAFKKRLGID